MQGGRTYLRPPGAAKGGKLSPGLHGAHRAARESRGTPAPNTSASEITFATDVSWL